MADAKYEVADIKAVTDTKERRKLSLMLEEVITIKNRMTEDETRLKKLKEEIPAILLSNGIECIAHQHTRFLVYRGHSVTLSRENLLSNGVDPRIIEESTVRKPYTTLQVTAIKGGGDE